MGKVMESDEYHGAVVQGKEVVGEREEEQLLEEEEEDDEELVLPGFRFHPTDEELVTFYLRRKVAGKRLSIEIIKELDIYKHEPSDLPSKYIYLFFFQVHNKIIITSFVQRYMVFWQTKSALLKHLILVNGENNNYACLQI
jgi:hypothetical protein